ncbi:MAG: hypothetical protein J6S60_06045 [Oscillospiraceae bacterium]|nr:hypothetical protein [Oscillospiraceae bacterium]
MDWRREARRALREYPRAKRRNGEADQAVIFAVEAALKMQDEYYNAAARRKMVELVYFRATHTMQGAAMECGYSIETVWKWNVEVLAAVYMAVLMQKSKPGA